MSVKFSEIVIEGRFMMVKGFLLGFLSQAKADGKYFFHRKEGIRRETFKEMIKEFFELDNHTHICLEDDLVDRFVDAGRLYQSITGNEIKSIKPIKGASFTFSFEVFNKDLAKEIKDILQNLPDGVKLEDYIPFEEKDDEGKGIEGYAPLHEYTSRGRGRFNGNFEGVMDIYLKIKRSDLSESVVCSDVHLNFDK